MTNVGALPLPRGQPVICASVEWSGGTRGLDSVCVQFHLVMLFK